MLSDYRKRTPLPIPEREARSRGSGPVITYKLSPEELEKYRSMPGAYRRGQDGKKINPPVIIKTNFTVKEEDEDMPAAERFIPDKTEFLKQIAAGKSISKLEREWAMKPGSLHYWVGKWNLKGIKPERAQQLLDEMVLDGELKPEVSEEPVLREKDLPGRVPAEVEVSQVKDTEILRLSEELRATKAQLKKHIEESETAKAELAKVIGERNQFRDLYGRVEAENMQLREKAEKLERQLQAAEGYAEGVPTEHDPVHSPAHYTAGGIETIQFIRAKLTPEEFRGFCKGNVLKYIARANLKGGSEDHRKAAKYLEWLIEEGDVRESQGA